MRAKVMAVVLAVVGLALSGAGEGVKVTPAETKHGVTCRITNIAVTTSLVVEGGERQHGASASLIVEGAGAYALDQPSFTEVLDEQEKDIRIPVQTSPQPDEYARQRLESMFANALHRDPRSSEGTSVHSNLTRCPEKVQRMSGVLPVVLAKRTVREKVELKEMAEAVEIAPGVTFLLTKVEPAGGSTTLSYEARVRRGREGVPPGLEPVFPGIVVREAGGGVITTLHYGQPVETRDEYIYVVKNVGVAQSYLERGATLEACVFDGLERVEFKFGVSNLEVVTAAKEPKK